MRLIGDDSPEFVGVMSGSELSVVVVVCGVLSV